MKSISLKYGSTEINADIPEELFTGLVEPEKALNLPEEDQLRLIKQALSNPAGKSALRELAKAKNKAAVVISDITRLAPSHLILPVLLAELEKGGIDSKNITIIIGLGNHRTVTEKEKIDLVGQQIYDKYRCIHSKEDRYVSLGSTSRGTPVEINEYVAGADLKILTGNIELHRLAGYSGGSKGCIGISSPSAIEQNHKLSQLGQSQPGKLSGNPVREDLDEYATIVGIDFIVNVVTDEKGNIESAYGGDFYSAHLKGVPAVKQKYLRKISGPVDLVISSVGGMPKDNSLYQALKAVQNAMNALKHGGIVVIAASCFEGFGDKKFKEWALQCNSVEALLHKGQKDFVLGAHKAVMAAKLLQKGQVFIVSDMEKEEVKKLGFKPFTNLQTAIDTAVKELNRPAVLVIPYGGVTFPYYEE